MIMSTYRTNIFGQNKKLSYRTIEDQTRPTRPKQHHTIQYRAIYVDEHTRLYKTNRPNMIIDHTGHLRSFLSYFVFFIILYPTPYLVTPYESTHKRPGKNRRHHILQRPSYLVGGPWHYLHNYYKHRSDLDNPHCLIPSNIPKDLIRRIFTYSARMAANNRTSVYHRVLQGMCVPR